MLEVCTTLLSHSSLSSGRLPKREKDVEASLSPAVLVEFTGTREWIICIIPLLKRTIVALFSLLTSSAVHHLTTTLAVKLVPHGIRVNAIAPGIFPSGMVDLNDKTNPIVKAIEGVPLRRPGKDTVRSLSDESNFRTWLALYYFYRARPVVSSLEG
jgi:Enoyl-(Acyl carrier protein) reductase